MLEYFISTHGARKGLADTALRTADSGYLTRRLIDVAQDVIILEEDCGTQSRHLAVGARGEGRAGVAARSGSSAAGPPPTSSTRQTGEIIVERNEEIDEEAADAHRGAGHPDEVHVRSPLTCQAKRGICRLCYGRNLARGKLVEHGRGRGHRRRPEHRRARHPAHHAHLPHRRRGRPGHHQRPAPRGGAVRGPGAQGRRPSSPRSTARRRSCGRASPAGSRS